VGELLDWIETPSVSGSEGDFADQVAAAGAARGFDVTRLPVGDDGRASLLLCAEEPEVVLCTHLDTVPPWIGARADRTHVHGRGACDAKGIALAMLEAARALLDEGRAGVGLLFTVGEEVDSDGARAAERWRAEREGQGLPVPQPRWIVVGEPTSNRFVSGHKGMLRATLSARGVAAHSSTPRGPSAVHGLVRCCAGLLDVDWGEHPALGAGTLNIGTLAGGVADNVVAAQARADLLLRCVRDPDQDRRRIEAALTPELGLEVHSQYGPVEFEVPAGEAADPVPFGTDAPFLAGWGRPLLIGPGEIALAHTPEERIAIDELDRGVERYRRLAADLLDRSRAADGDQG
jgi:acetylornithine deacetylase